jgi:hypothetical protein
MRCFGKRPNSADMAFILQSDKPPFQCIVLERTLRIVRLSVVDPTRIEERFTLVMSNGIDKLLCQTMSRGDDYVLARYYGWESTDNIGLTGVGATLGEAKRWKGSN